LAVYLRTVIHEGLFHFALATGNFFKQAHPDLARQVVAVKNLDLPNDGAIPACMPPLECLTKFAKAGSVGEDRIQSLARSRALGEVGMRAGDVCLPPSESPCSF
jgi:hypothetical protein